MLVGVVLDHFKVDILDIGENKTTAKTITPVFATQSCLHGRQVPDVFNSPGTFG